MQALLRAVLARFPQLARQPLSPLLREEKVIQYLEAVTTSDGHHELESRSTFELAASPECACVVEEESKALILVGGTSGQVDLLSFEEDTWAVEGRWNLGDEDISCVTAVSGSGTLVAVAGDDAGGLWLLEPAAGEAAAKGTKLAHGHGAGVGCVSLLQPASSDLLLFSAAYDCTVLAQSMGGTAASPSSVVWESKVEALPPLDLAAQGSAPVESAGAGSMSNPPFPHACAVVGDSLALACGDGVVRLLRCDTGSLHGIAVGLHTAAVTVVAPLPGSVCDGGVLAGGMDGKVGAWRLRSAPADPEAVDVLTPQNDTMWLARLPQDAGAGKRWSANAMAGLELDDPGVLLVAVAPAGERASESGRVLLYTLNALP